MLRLLILDVRLSTSEAKPQRLLSGLQKIGATAVLLVGPTRPHLAILDFLKCVQTVRTFAGKLSMVWPHDVTRVLNETVPPASITRMTSAAAKQCPGKNHGLRLASLRLLQFVRTSGLPGMATHLEAKQPLSHFGLQSIG